MRRQWPEQKRSPLLFLGIIQMPLKKASKWGIMNIEAVDPRADISDPDCFIQEWQRAAFWIVLLGWASKEWQKQRLFMAATGIWGHLEWILGDVKWNCFKSVFSRKVLAPRKKKGLNILNRHKAIRMCGRQNMSLSETELTFAEQRSQESQ